VTGQFRLALAAVYTISRTVSVTGRSALALTATFQLADGEALDSTNVGPPRLGHRDAGPPGLDWATGPPHVGRN
jgi:hypothetical protein